MKTISYTDEHGDKYTTEIDRLIELVRCGDELEYCVFLSYYSNCDKKATMFVVSGSVEECLAYVWMFVVDAGHADVFEVGGPLWDVPDDLATVRGSYDELHIVPLSVANAHEHLRREMGENHYWYDNLKALRARCLIV